MGFIYLSQGKALPLRCLIYDSENRTISVPVASAIGSRTTAYLACGFAFFLKIPPKSFLMLSTKPLMNFNILFRLLSFCGFGYSVAKPLPLWLASLVFINPTASSKCRFEILSSDL